MNNFQPCFLFRSRSCPVMPAVLIISRGECTTSVNQPFSISSYNQFFNKDLPNTFLINKTLIRKCNYHTYFHDFYLIESCINYLIYLFRFSGSISKHSLPSQITIIKILSSFCAVFSNFIIVPLNIILITSMICSRILCITNLVSGYIICPFNCHFICCITMGQVALQLITYISYRGGVA